MTMTEDLKTYLCAVCLACALLGSLVLIDRRWVRVLVATVAVCLVSTTALLALIR